MTPCPPRAHLEQLLRETLGPADRSIAEDHLADCAACQAALEQLTQDDAADHWRELQRQTEEAPMAVQQVLGHLLGNRVGAELESLTQSLLPVNLARTQIRSGRERTNLPQYSYPVVPGYEVLGELGRGGMGVVYKARQVRLNRLVALKMVLKGNHADVEELARLRREAETVAQLQHPHIVQVHEVGEVDGLPYLCLEYVDGSNLAQVLAGQPQDAREAAELIETLARAMHVAH